MPYNLNQLYWLLDHICLENTEDAALDNNILHQVLRTYGGVTDTNSIVSSVNSNDIYAINQNLIWNIINNEVNSRCWSIIESNNNLKTIYNAYENGIVNNANYNRYTESNISIDKSNAKVLDNGVVGPFKINGSGGIYRINTSGTVGSTTVTTKLYKEADCKNLINEYDNYYGNAYVKLDGFKTNTQVTAKISLKHSYITEGRFWYTDGTVSAGQEAQPLISFKRKTKTVSVEQTGKKLSGSYHLNIVKKDINDANDSKSDSEKYKDALGNAKFSIKSSVTGETISVTSVAKTLKRITGFNNQDEQGNIEITGEGWDTYTIKETNPPPEYVGDTWTINLCVHKAETSSGYEIDQVKFQGANLAANNKVVNVPASGNGWLKIKEDGNWTTDVNENNYRVAFEFNKHTVTVTWKNEPIEGNFDLDLVKYVQGTTVPLKGAEFKVSIKDDKQTELANTNKKYTTGDDGHFTEKVKAKISDKGKKYTITITETGVPEGYEGLSGPISFNAVSELSKDGKSYVLKASESTTIANSKKVTIKSEEILIEAENKPEGPHKGVKKVENQDSGYYDEVTGAVYTDKEKLESTFHDWVITTKIPSGISKYETYILTDPIDERLIFSGLDRVKVKYVDGENLTLDKDYKLDYNETTKTLSIIFINNDFDGGKTLEEGKTIEIRFNTTFAKDEDGNIIAINQKVENQATLIYGNGCELKTEIPEVHTGGVGLYKYNEKTGKALEGAKFKIATSKENAKNGIFVKDANGNDIEKVTNDKGIAVFDGLEFGEDAIDKVKETIKDPITGADVYTYNWEEAETTYYIVETETPEGFSQIEKPIEAIVKKDNYDINDITTLIQVGNESNIFDLSLRKFITAVKDGSTGEEETVTTRIPQVDTTNLINGKSTTATYTHPKDPVLVHTTDTVTYTIRVYNEGPQDAYASIIKDDIPEGLEFVTYTEGDGSVNDKYRWKLVDENDNEVTDSSKAKYIITDYLSQENGEKLKIKNEEDKNTQTDSTLEEENNENGLTITEQPDTNAEENPNLLKAFIPETMTELDYRDVKVQFKVTEPTTSDRILINYAQIAEEKDKNGKTVTDRDSTPNEWKGEDDEDIEKVRVLYFDLALRKWVTQAIVTENGQTQVTETGHKAEDDPEEVVKVDLKKSKINNVTVKFKYSIRITNEGEIAGEATEIRDDVPQGLKFVAEDNPDWREENGQIVTNKLAGTTLQPGESAEVEILLTWVNSKENMGVMINTAEINKDHNEYGTPDIDSTPGNNVPGEDDIDDAPVMLTIKTGSEIIMIATLGLGVIAIVGVGVLLIKRKVLIK